MPHYRHLLTEKCVIQRLVDVDDYGDPVWGECNEVPCAVSHANVVVRDADGTERSSSHQMVTEVSVDASDRIWLPGSNPNDPQASRTPLSVRWDQSRRTGVALYQTFF